MQLVVGERFPLAFNCSQNHDLQLFLFYWINEQLRKSLLMPLLSRVEDMCFCDCQFCLFVRSCMHACVFQFDFFCVRMELLECAQNWWPVRGKKNFVWLGLYLCVLGRHDSYWKHCCYEKSFTRFVSIFYSN
jgi:hypothetical protein